MGRADANLATTIKWAITGIVAIMCISTFMNGWTAVPPGHRGVKVFMGKVTPGTLGEGLQFHLPWVSSVEIVEVREQKYEITTSASSNDLQEITAKVAINYRPELGDVDKLFQDIGREYVDRVIDPAVQEVVKSVTANYTAEDLIKKRTLVRSEMETQVAAKIEGSHVKILKFNIVDFGFSKEFNESIEAKQKAEQDALREENVLRQRAIQADQEIETARGIAESLKLQASAEAEAITMTAEAEAKAQILLADAVTDKVLQLRALEKWDGVLPKVTGDVVPFIQIDTSSKSKK